MISRSLRWMLFVSLAAFAGTPAYAETAWDLPLVWPEGNFHVENAKAFAAAVDEATGGEVVITVHPGGALGLKGPEILAAVRDGTVPIGEMLLPQQAAEEPLLGLAANPNLASNHDEIALLHKHWLPHVHERAVGHNQKFLYFVPWPTTYLYAQVPLETVEDLQALKVRTAFDALTAAYDRIGATTVQLPWGDVVPALNEGTIDAVATSASSGVDGKFWEHFSYMYVAHFLPASNAVSVNLDAWNTLSTDHQAAIEDVAARLQPRFWAVSEAEDALKVKILTDSGIVIAGELAPVLIDHVRAAMEPILDESVESIGQPAGAIVEAFRADIAD
ncbi:TRAP transporter substrate-binding protein [Bauldia sp.]|uniref:TRAP transporter substrate-binding protein n=1 Tax=Bauldia sp. TaxID=2575872 RepID=UPI003BAAC1D3